MQLSIQVKRRQDFLRELFAIQLIGGFLDSVSSVWGRLEVWLRASTEMASECESSEGDSNVSRRVRRQRCTSKIVEVLCTNPQLGRAERSMYEATGRNQTDRGRREGRRCLVR